MSFESGIAGFRHKRKLAKESMLSSLLHPYVEVLYSIKHL